jgi:hypothetical protein
MSPLARKYFGMWLRKTFSGSWGIAMFAAGVLGLGASFVADRYPLWSGLANRAAWQLPLGLFILTLIPAASHASWVLYADVLERFAKQADEAEDLRHQLADRMNYEQLAHALSVLHREASEGWINLIPSNDQAIAEQWKPKVDPWVEKVKAVLLVHRVPHADLAHFEVVNNLDIERFAPHIRDEVRRMWVRVERVGQLAKKYEERSGR